jgi:hypothetical protein
MDMLQGHIRKQNLEQKPALPVFNAKRAALANGAKIPELLLASAHEALAKPYRRQPALMFALAWLCPRIQKESLEPWKVSQALHG